MTSCINPKELRFSPPTRVYPRFAQHPPGEAALIHQPMALRIQGVPAVVVFVQWSSAPNCWLLWAVKPLPGSWGHVPPLVILPGALVLHPGIWNLLQVLGRLSSPHPHWSLTWKDRLPLSMEAQDTCAGLWWCHKVLPEELPTIWHTTGGHGPRPPSHCASPHGHLWGPESE